MAGLYDAWEALGSQKLPWRRLVEPAVVLAREGFIVTDGLARSLKGVLPKMKKYPASMEQFSRKGVPYEMGDILRQPDLAKTLERIARPGPARLLRRRNRSPHRPGDEGERRPHHRS